ncbi:MAG: AI-2E family transporter [Bryobacteraceae bacterium]
MLGFDSRAARATWTVLAVLLLAAALCAIRRTLFVFVVAILLAYMLLPLVDWIDRKLPIKRSRTPALAIVYVALVTAVAWISAEVGAKAAEQANLLASKIPDLLDPARTGQLPLPEFLRPWSANLTAMLREYSKEILAKLPAAVLRAAGAAANLIFVVIVPILSFFFLKDGHSIHDWIMRSLPDPRRRSLVEEIGADLNLLLAQYMRALVLLGLATAFCYGVFFTVIGVPYGVLLAAISFPLEFIPMIGPLVSAAIILAVAGFSGFPHLVAIVVFLIVFRLFQDYVLQPFLMSSGIELHPLVVIFGVFAGEQIAGIEGAFLSVPVLATLRIVYRRLIAPRLAPAPAALK